MNEDVWGIVFDFCKTESKKDFVHLLYVCKMFYRLFHSTNMFENIWFDECMLSKWDDSRAHLIKKIHIPISKGDNQIGLNKFNPQIYHQVTHLALQSQSQISNIFRFPHLKHVDFRHCNLKDCSFLKNIPLTSLVLAHNNIKCLNDIPSSILSLYTSHNNISIFPENKFFQLKTLDLHVNNLSSIQPLEKCIHLTFLNLALNLIQDVSPLAFLTDLRTLILSKNKILSLSPLKNLKRLKKLQLDHNPCNDLSPLENLTCLEYLDVSFMDFNDIQPLENLIPSLKFLFVFGFEFDSERLKKFESIEMFATD